MATFTLEISGDKEMQMLLNRMENLDTTGLMEGLSELMVEQTKNRLYYTKTAPDGTPWAPWSERYARTRQGNHSLLIDSSRLLNTIYATNTKTTAAAHSNVVYANTHQRGNPNKNIPARPFLGTSPEDLNELHDSGVAYLEALFGAIVFLNRL